LLIVEEIFQRVLDFYVVYLHGIPSKNIAPYNRENW